jgi:hypothetical protein
MKKGQQSSVKREAVIEKINRRVNRRREAKRKARLKRKLKLKLEAEQEVAHIDEMLKFESGSRVKMRRKARHPMTAKIGKAMKKKANSERNAKHR